MTRDAPDENMVSPASQICRDIYKIFARLAPQATKIFYIRHMITKWFRHFAKMTVTNMTFRQFWKACDAWLTNWSKWYSNWTSTGGLAQLRVARSLYTPISESTTHNDPTSIVLVVHSQLSHTTKPGIDWERDQALIDNFQFFTTGWDIYSLIAFHRAITAKLKARAGFIICSGTVPFHSIRQSRVTHPLLDTQMSRLSHSFLPGAENFYQSPKIVEKHL